MRLILSARGKALCPRSLSAEQADVMMAHFYRISQKRRAYAAKADAFLMGNELPFNERQSSKY